MRTFPRSQSGIDRWARPLSAAALAASVLLLFSVLLPWMGITVLVFLSVDGTDTSEGVVCMAMAIVGGTAAVVSLAGGRLALLPIAGGAGAVALIAAVVLALRLEEAFAQAVSREEAAEIEDLVEGALSLEAGWFLAVVAALTMLFTGAYAAHASGRFRRTASDC